MLRIGREVGGGGGRGEEKVTVRQMFLFLSVCFFLFWSHCLIDFIVLVLHWLIAFFKCILEVMSKVRSHLLLLLLLWHYTYFIMSTKFPINHSLTFSMIVHCRTEKNVILTCSKYSVIKPGERSEGGRVKCVGGGRGRGAVSLELTFSEIFLPNRWKIWKWKLRFSFQIPCWLDFLWNYLFLIPWGTH